MSAIAKHAIGDVTAEVHRYSDVLAMNPRRMRDENMGTMLIWSDSWESPDEREWSSKTEWMAHMLDSVIGAKQLIACARAGEFEDRRVVELEDEDDGAVMAIQGRGQSCPGPETGWLDLARFDFGDAHEICMGFRGDIRVAEALAGSPSAADVLGGFVHLLPVYMTGGRPSPEFNTTGYGNSGCAGYIFCTHDRAVEVLGSKVTEEQALDALADEVRRYGQQAAGNCYMVFLREQDGSGAWDGEFYDIDPYDAASVAEACGLEFDDGIDARDLLRAYDAYIAAAFEAGLPETGWCPVCAAEFAEHEYKNVWLAGESFDYMLKDNSESCNIEVVESPGCCCTIRLLKAAEQFAEECRAEARRLVADGETPYDQPLVTPTGIIADAVSWGPDEDGEYCNSWPLTEESNSRPFGCRFTVAAGLTVLDVMA